MSDHSDRPPPPDALTPLLAETNRLARALVGAAHDHKLGLVDGAVLERLAAMVGMAADMAAEIREHGGGVRPDRN